MYQRVLNGGARLRWETKLGRKLIVKRAAAFRRYSMSRSRIKTIKHTQMHEIKYRMSYILTVNVTNQTGRRTVRKIPKPKRNYLRITDVSQNSRLTLKTLLNLMVK